MIYASSLKPEGKKSSLIVDIMNKFDDASYLSGVGAKDYHDQSLFDKNGIQVIWQEFEHPFYKQQYGDFEPYLSAIDLLLNCGIDRSREIIRG